MKNVTIPNKLAAVRNAHYYKLVDQCAEMEKFKIHNNVMMEISRMEMDVPANVLKKLYQLEQLLE